MEYKVLRYCILLRFFMEVISCCHQSSHPNLCGYDGVEYNVSEFEDVCDCQSAVFCSVISFVGQCNSSVIQLGINESSDILSQLSCDILPLESQAQIPTVEVLNNTGNGLSLQVSPDSLFGKYKIFCTAPELSEELNNTSNNEWEIVGVDPAEVFVDSEVNLQLGLSRGAANASLAWCFVYNPDGDAEILSAVDISEEQLTCSEFRPMIPGVFRVSLSYDIPSDTLGKSVEVNVKGKHPVAQKADYDSDFKTIFISFDANIELHSKCTDAFPKTSRENFGAGFDCYTRANILGIKMGAHFAVIGNVTIKSENKICREGYRHSGFCLAALPANLSISKPKASGPRVSFYTADVCAGNKTRKYINVRAFNSNQQTIFKNQTLQANGGGKTHRKNLMIWRNVRKIQSKLSSRLILNINNTDYLPLYENLSDYDMDLDAGNNNLGFGAIVSVKVEYSDRSSALLAEAHVRFCDDSAKLYRYNWFLNGRNLSEEGRLLTLSNLSPGKYLVKCVVVAHDSTEILGQGWATAEVFESIKDVLVLPLEAAIGTKDDLYLRAVSSQASPVSWTCRTAVGEPCLTRNKSLLSDIYDFTSPGIFLPAGTLPVADYVWTVESSGEAKVAKIFIKPGEVSINVEVPSVLVNPSLGVVLNGSVQGAMEECYAGWSSQRQKGFSYFNLHDVGVKQILIDERHPRTEIPLAIPPASSGLQADSQYLFKFQVFCPQSGSLRYTKVPLRTGAPSEVLPISVEPLKGEAMTTNFKVSVPEANASVQSHPLVFEWSYVDPCSTEVPLGRGLSTRNFTTYLPPGDVKIMVRVCDERKICSTSVSSPVAVIQPTEIHPENFDKTLRQIQYSMVSGDAREALGLAVTVFKSLALLAELELRQKVFSVVEEAISVRIEDLSEKLRFHPNALQLSWEFYDQAESVAKYFHKNSAILKRLKDFRNGLKSRSKNNKIRRKDGSRN